MRKGPYAVILALVENAQVQLGVMGCPNMPVGPLGQGGPRGCIFVAVRGQGAEQVHFSFVFRLPKLTTRQLTLSGSNSSDLSISAFAPSKLNFIESADGSHPFNDQVASILGITNPHTSMDSMAVYCSLARGDGGVYLRMPTNTTFKENIWVGVISPNVDGKRHSFASRTILRVLY
jgi:3'(2'), 5'-bisphosphate nucleotidase